MCTIPLEWGSVAHGKRWKHCIWRIVRFLEQQVEDIPGLRNVYAMEDKLLARLPELVKIVIFDQLYGN